MARKDAMHDAARRALENDGWTVTHDPLQIPKGKQALYIDIGAEMPIAAERDGRKIAVEVKSFLGKSGITDLYGAVGQFMFYRFMMQRRDPERTLYLALSAEAYEEILNTDEGRDFIRDERLKLIVFRAETEAIEQWIE